LVRDVSEKLGLIVSEVFILNYPKSLTFMKIIRLYGVGVGGKGVEACLDSRLRMFGRFLEY